jgi:hypothetical protein
MQFIETNRLVSASVDFHTQEFSSNSPGLFEETASVSQTFQYCSGQADATQNSLIESNRITGNGTSSTFQDCAIFYVQSGSSLNATFDLSAPTDYQLAGTLSGTGIGSFVRLTYLPDNSHVFSFDADKGITPLTGTLAPGSYEFRAEATFVTDDFAMFQFDFQTTPIPEPHAGLLLLALVVATARNRFGAR